MSRTNYLTAINSRINELMGLNFAESQHKTLERNLTLAANTLKINSSLESLLEWISQPKIPALQLDILAQHLTVGETYFFREMGALNLLQNKIIPAIAAQDKTQKKQIKIWSAGCSSGEEPYSIAMTLKECLPDFNQWNITLIATDLSTKALEKAKTGIYTPWSFRDTPEELKTKYFTQKGKNFEIKPEIKKMVAFTQLNLATDVFPDEAQLKQIDMVFCRNVLMYFSPEMIHRITKKFYETLKMDGWLITSQVELNDVYFGNFQKVMFDNGIFYRKTTQKQMQAQPLKIQLPFNVNSTMQVRSRINQNGKKKTQAARPDFKALKTKKAPNVHQSQQINDNAELLYLSAKHEACIRQCLRMIELHGFNNKTALLLAKSYADTGRLDEALDVAEKIVSSDDSIAEHHYMRAIILLEKKQWEEADKSLVKTLYLESKHIAARLSRSQVLKHLGKHQQAKKEIQNLLTDIEEFDDNETLPYLEGITAGRIRQLAGLMKESKT